ncbi:MAG: hypothetical protein Kow0099_35220 [Candidatus Abyssubacteria bacterium]
MTDMNGQTAKSYEYDAYGNILQETGPSLTGVPPRGSDLEI